GCVLFRLPDARRPVERGGVSFQNIGDIEGEPKAAEGAGKRLVDPAASPVARSMEAHDALFSVAAEAAQKDGFPAIVIRRQDTAGPFPCAGLITGDGRFGEPLPHEAETTDEECVLRVFSIQADDPVFAILAHPIPDDIQSDAVRPSADQTRYSGRV